MDNLMLLILIGGGGLFFVLVVVGLVVTRSSEKSMLDKRIGTYISDEERKAIREQQKSSASPVGDWVNKRVEKSKVGGGVAKELARADLKLKPAEYFALMVILGFLGGFLFWFFSGRSTNPLNIALYFVIGFFIGAQVPRMQVKRLQKKRLIRFGEQLADMLNLMVNGLRAGYSTMQAMEAVSKELPPPISDEFRRVVQEMQLGISMERALDNLLRRIPSEDLDLVITAVNVQREVGGNLAEILDTISFTIRERVRIKGEIRVLTSQVALSGRFLSFLPLMIMAVLWFLNKSYMMEFFNPETRIPGIIALSIGGGMILAGYVVMGKIADIEV